MRTAASRLLALILGLAVLGQGCTQSLREPASTDERTAWDRPTWGQPVEGLQCRLRPLRRTWQPGELPVFRLDVRNRGKRTFALPAAQVLELCEIKLDGRWRHWPQAVTIDSPLWELAPGIEFTGITISPHEQFSIEPKPGRHVIRLALTLEGVTFITNPVGIETLTRPTR